MQLSQRETVPEASPWKDFDSELACSPGAGNEPQRMGMPRKGSAGTGGNLFGPQRITVTVTRTRRRLNTSLLSHYPCALKSGAH